MLCSSEERTGTPHRRTRAHQHSLIQVSYSGLRKELRQALGACDRAHLLLDRVGVLRRVQHRKRRRSVQPHIRRARHEHLCDSLALRSLSQRAAVIEAKRTPFRQSRVRLAQEIHLVCSYVGSLVKVRNLRKYSARSSARCTCASGVEYAAVD